MKVYLKVQSPPTNLNLTWIYKKLVLNVIPLRLWSALCHQETFSCDSAAALQFEENNL